MVNEKLINTRQSQVEDRGYETVTGKIDKVLDILRSMTSRLLEKRALAAQQSQDARARGAAKEAAARDAAARETAQRAVAATELEPRPLEVVQSGTPARHSRVLPAALTAAGVVGLAAGGWFGFQAKKHADHAGDSSFVGGQLEIARSRSLPEDDGGRARGRRRGHGGRARLVAMVTGDGAPGRRRAHHRPAGPRRRPRHRILRRIE